MRLMHRTRRLFRNLFRSDAVARELDAELEAYAELASAEKEGAGVAPDEARRQALAELGGKDAVQRRVRERRTGYAIDLLRQDLTYGLRMMVNKPGFSLLLVGTLALGLAASTAMFSVVSAVLLDPLPYPEANQLVSIRPTARDGRRHFSPRDFVDFGDTTTSFADICAIQGSGLVTLSDSGRVAPVRARDVTTSVLDVYGVRPYLGRGFEPADEDTAAFAVTGLALSLVGVYGVLSQFVGRRQREIGIRMALGARQADVRRGVLQVGGSLVAAGVLLGLVVAAGLSSYLQSLLFEVSPVDTTVYSLVAAAVLLVGLAACDIPARRASRIDPVATLRLE